MEPVWQSASWPAVQALAKKLGEITSLSGSEAEDIINAGGVKRVYELFAHKVKAIALREREIEEQVRER